MENSIKYLSTISILPNEVLDKDIVFISKAAMTESARLKLKDRNCKVIPDIWDNHKKLKEGSVFLGTKKCNLLSGSFYVRAYQKIKKMIWGLIMRTFCLYVKFPEKYWKEINKAERFTDEGENVYRKFAEIYKQEDLYDTYFQEEKLLPQAN